MQMQCSSFTCTIAKRAYCQLYYCGLPPKHSKSLAIAGFVGTVWGCPDCWLKLKRSKSDSKGLATAGVTFAAGVFFSVADVAEGATEGVVEEFVFLLVSFGLCLSL